MYNKGVRLIVLDPELYKFSKCRKCNKIIPVGQMQHHMRSHKEKQFYQCHICGKTLSAQCALKKHIKTVHAGGMRYPCEICGKVLSYGTHRRHKLLMHNKEKSGFNFSCQKCGQTFVYESQVKRHQVSAHLGKEVRCTVSGCTKVFKCLSSLRYHLPSHQEERPVYPCPVCSKAYASRNTLRIHKRLHDKDRKTYSCHLCDKKVTTSASLRCHIRTHTGEKPFECDKCDKIFSSHNLLRTHSVVHTKERKHVCKVCQKAFTQRGPLKAHFLKDHPLEKL